MSLTVDRSRLPGVGPPPVCHFPAVRKGQLPNGLAVWTVEHRSVPVVTFVLLVTVGSAVDPPGRSGLASLTGDMLDEGAGARTAIEVNDALARIGAGFDTEVGPDATFLTLTTLARFRDRGLGLLSDLVVRPRFETHEFERVRELRANRLRQLRDLPPAVADRVFATQLYGDHPYGHLAIGTEHALQSITLDEVRTFHQRAYRPANATLIASGDATHDELFASVEAAFGSWSDAAAAHEEFAGSLPRALDAPTVVAPRLAVVDRPGSAQSELRIGHVAAPRSTPDYHALVLLNMALGGQFVSRINMNLREDKGFTYGARTSFDFRRGPGPFLLQVSVQTAVTADAIRESLAELRAVGADRPITDRELEVARAALTRGYPRNFETAEQIARSCAQLALYALPDDYFELYVPTVLGLDVDDIRRVAARWLDADQLSTLIVGDRGVFGPALASLGLGEPVAAEPA
jgi:predicted Zn-dependent peptidase